jgi:hypothetical protein
MRCKDGPEVDGPIEVATAGFGLDVNRTVATIKPPIITIEVATISPPGRTCAEWRARRPRFPRALAATGSRPSRFSLKVEKPLRL